MEFGGIKNLLDVLTEYINFGYFRFIADIHHSAFFDIALRNPKSTSFFL